jgi:hypothetical protein
MATDDDDLLEADTLEAEPDEEELADDFEDDVLSDDLDVVDEVVLVDVDDVDVVDGVDGVDVVVTDAVKERPAAEEKARKKEGDDDEEDDDDEVDPDDVEEDLDQILRDRIAAAPDEEEDEEEVVETDDRAETAGRVPGKRPGEFVCQSCFIVKHPSQLADAKLMYCTDCV